MAYLLLPFLDNDELNKEACTMVCIKIKYQYIYSINETYTAMGANQLFNITDRKNCVSYIITTHSWLVRFHSKILSSSGHDRIGRIKPLCNE